MSLKEKHKRAILAKFSPCRYEEKTRHTPAKKFEISCHSRPKFFFCLALFLHSKIVKEIKKRQQTVFHHFGDREEFFVEMVFFG